MTPHEAISVFMVCFGMAYPLLTKQDVWSAAILGTFLMGLGIYGVRDAPKYPTNVLVVLSSPAMDADEAEDKADFGSAL